MTTSVLWLRDFGIDIRCVKLQLYRNRDGLLLDASQMIPLPEASEYLVKLREKEEEVRRQRLDGARTSPGGQEFLESVEFAREDAKPTLRKVYQWAADMEREGIASLSTYKNTTNLRIKVSGADNAPVTVRNEPLKEEMRLRPKHFEKYAPLSKGRVETIIGRPFRESTTPIFLSSITDGPRAGLLDALTDAYREANGLPPTILPPDTAPDSPAPAV